jgi:hypothetical protein
VDESGPQLCATTSARAFALRMYIVVLYFMYLSKCKIPFDQFNTSEVNESDRENYAALLNY